MHCVVITGATRGLGLELGRAFLAGCNLMISITRKSAATLCAEARSRGIGFLGIRADLTAPDRAARLLEGELKSHPDITSLVLINDAGMVAPQGDFAAADYTVATAACLVNIATPIALTAAVLRGTVPNTPIRVVNISSGAGRKDVPGWAVYCATKAALDRFTSTAALDATHQQLNVRYCSLAPGVVDTDMQAEIRSADPACFPNLPRFVQLKEEGALTPAPEAARKIYNYVNSDAFGTTPIADIRSL